MIFIKNFKELGKEDASIAGGKGASLGEMTSAFATSFAQGFGRSKKASAGQAGWHNPVPPGFVLLSGAFEHFLDETNLNVEIDAILATVNTEEMRSVEHASERIQKLILEAKMPKDIASAIEKDFATLDAKWVAVRSSATAEDSDSAAWAGQLDTYLNTTKKTLLRNVQRCWASLFTSRAIFYRFEKGLHASKISVAVVVQKMIQSEVSGIAFTVHPVTEDPDQMIIEAGLGLGEAIVSGQITPDSYVVDKIDFSILDISVAEQSMIIVRGGKDNIHKKLSAETGGKQKLHGRQIVELAKICKTIEEHYGKPQDIEWALADDKFYITQSRPITTLSDAKPVKKKIKSEEREIDAKDGTQSIEDYDFTYEGQGTKFIFEDLARKYYLPAGSVGIVKDGKDYQYIAKTTVAKMKKIGERRSIADTHRVRTKLKQLSDESIRKTKEYASKKVITQKEVVSALELLADIMREYFYFDYSFWDGAFQKSKIDPVGKKNIELVEKYKNEVRAFLDPVFAGEGLLAVTLKRTHEKTGVPPSDLEWYTHEELIELFDRKEPSFDELTARRKASVYYRDARKKLHVYYGREAEEFIKHFLQVSETNSINLVGKVAHGQGRKVKGRVRILKRDYGDISVLERSMKEMKKGEILVSQSTDPQLMPAFRKAAAVITDVGGMLSHAAISARELDIPCIVETKNASKVLKTGDLVEVDADKGVVRILERSENEERYYKKLRFIKKGRWATYPMETENWHNEHTSNYTEKHFGVWRETFAVCIFGKEYENHMYVPERYVKRLHARIKEITDSDPKGMEKLQLKFYDERKAARKEIPKINPTDLSKLTNKELTVIFRKNRDASHRIVIYDQFTWLAEDYWPPLMDDVLVNKIGLAKDSAEYNDCLFALIKPREISTTLEEKRSVAEYALKIKSGKETREKAAAALAGQYGYMPVLTYGTAWDAKKYEQELNSAVAKDEESLKKEFLELKNYTELRDEDVERMVKKYEIAAGDLQVFIDFGLAIDTRNEAEYVASLCGFYLMRLYDEIVKRLNCSVIDLRTLFESEIIDCLEGRTKVVDCLSKKGTFLVWGMNADTKKKIILSPEEGERAFAYLEEQDRTMSKKTGEQVHRGITANGGKVKGKIRKVPTPDDNHKVQEGDILVAYSTMVDNLPAMKKAAAIVTESGGLTCHAAVVAREFGIPCVVGLKDAMSDFNDGDMVEVDADAGIVRIIERAKNQNHSISSVTQDNKVWVRNFSGVQIGLQVFAVFDRGLKACQDILFGRNQPPVITEFFWYMQGVDLEGAYFLKDEMHTFVKMICEAIYTDPKKVERIHQETYMLNDKYFAYTKKHLEDDLHKLSNRELGKIYATLTDLQIKAHEYAVTTTWFVDSTDQIFSKRLIAETKNIVEKSGLDKNPLEVFTLLTTPSNGTFAMQEELEFLEILKLIQTNKHSVKVFSSLSDYFVMPKNVDHVVAEALYKHCAKWKWVPFGYMGPAYELDHYLFDMATLVRLGEDAEKEIIEKKKQRRTIEKQREELFKELNIGAKTKKVYDIAADITLLKTYRKDCLYYGMYFLDKLFREMKNRLGIELLDMHYLYYTEIKGIFVDGKTVDKQEIISRKKSAVYYQKNNKRVEILTEQEAESFLQNITIEEEKLDDQNGVLKGTCACSGFAQGRVKIINRPEEMGKMEQGDIMVSHTTFPSLVPAMKKATAIITEDGGITCHAAIVARELKVPCVTGIKVATQVLKDGDLVEVDADKGIVTILKKAEKQ